MLTMPIYSVSLQSPLLSYSVLLVEMSCLDVFPVFFACLVFLDSFLAFPFLFFRGLSIFATSIYGGLGLGHHSFD